MITLPVSNIKTNPNRIQVLYPCDNISMVNITPAPVPVPEAVIAKVAKERETLRIRHGVQLVQGADEGDILKYARGGIYGFTYAPQTLDCGLFTKNPYLSF